MSFNKPTSDEWRSVENYVWNKKQLDEKECRFIYHKEDLVTLRPGREHAWLDSSVEKMLRWLNCGLIEARTPTNSPGSHSSILTNTVALLLQSEFSLPFRPLEFTNDRLQETRQKSKGIEVYYSRLRIERFVVAIITLVILILLVIPIYLLHLVTSEVLDADRENAVCVGILLVSTLFFSAVISAFTRARRHEIFAASAA